MPASIVIAGIPLNLTSFQEAETTYRGELVDSFDNTPLDGRDKPRRMWEGETDSLALPVDSALRAAVASGPVTCSGLVLGETVTAIVLIRNSRRGPDVSSGGLTNWSGVNVVLSFTMKEAQDPVTPAFYLNDGGTYVPVTPISF